MQKGEISSGVYPAMLTPFFEDLTIDYEGLNNMTEWLLQKGCQGLLAVCGSSEMTLLTLEERVKIARTVVRKASEYSVTVAACGHVSSTLDQQIEEINAISETGIDVFVLVSGRIAHRYQDDRVFLKNMERLLARTGSIPLGLYECPSPYNRQLTPEVLKELAATGRFVFSKDTSCSESIHGKIDAVRNSPLKIFTAYTPLLLDAMQHGGQGYCGIHANYFPDLYEKLWELFRQGSLEQASRLQSCLTTLSKTDVPYNIGTKYYLSTFEHVPMAGYSRIDNRRLSELEKRELADYYQTVEQIREMFCVGGN